MVRTRAVLPTNRSIVYSCPPDAVQGSQCQNFSTNHLPTERAFPIAWTVVKSGKVKRMSTTGNGCSMQYSFNGTGISVQAESGFSHGVYSCALDGQSPQYFTANAGTSGVGGACVINGVSNQTHLITITNGPLPGWDLTIGDITITQSTTAISTNATTFTSTFPPYQLPPSLAGANATASASTSAATYTSTPASISTPIAPTFTGQTQSSISGNVDGASKSSFRTALAFAIVLGLIAVFSSTMAILFWNRYQKTRRVPSSRKTHSQVPTPYSALAGEEQGGSVEQYDPWQGGQAFITAPPNGSEERRGPTSSEGLQLSLQPDLRSLTFQSEEDQLSRTTASIHTITPVDR
ncbi:hypothetical protein FRB94_009595 [Tulasnella sp. JGI-2019a]|nr:hypothetical protein FRB94_009595 [Tulasnella sp. JGI-2019a]KAG9037738.1 hypothetical protein FRB95_004584 [Tulasnella sp. JGI-2019a]